MKAQIVSVNQPALKVVSLQSQNAIIPTSSIISLNTKKEKEKDVLKTHALASEPGFWDEAWFNHYE